MNRINKTMILAAGLALAMAACTSDDELDDTINVIESDGKYVGKAVGNFSADEWYPGGKLGTTENVYAGCYQDRTPSCMANIYYDAFFMGEQMFEKRYTETTKPYLGLGPASVRTSCIDCHPGYGHGKRMENYVTQYQNGNGYLLAVYHPTDGANSNDGPYIAEVTGMPQTQATAPFKAPIDESLIQMTWHKVTAMPSGIPLQFPDGETFELIYPEVTIPAVAFNTSPQPTNVAVRLESTIGIIGSGIIDAIPEDSIKAQYAATAAYAKAIGREDLINSNFWDIAANDFAAGALYSLNEGKRADGTYVPAGTKALKRFTYAMTRASLQDGPGANAIWNITNVSRPDRPKLYTTSAWALAMSQDADVIASIKANPSSPYYYDGTDAGIAEAVRALLDPATNQFDNAYHNFSPEMSSEQFYNLMVWHRGLAIPRARDLNDKEVQRGKEMFTKIGCANCHRPKWQTTDDNYWTPACIADKPLPQYKHQTIYPYSDFMHHKLDMVNDIHGSWCRTTPLWGRGLSMLNTGAQDRLHDCRARNEIEAIMWHAYSKNSHAYDSTLKFYNLPKADRDAIVRFLRSI